MVLEKRICSELELKGLKILIEEGHANKFLTLEVNQFKYGLKWYDYGQSEPETLYLEKFDLLLIGAGSTVVGISTNAEVVKFCVGLSNPFSFFLNTDLDFIIVTETTILVVNSHNCSISRLTGTPDGDIIQNVKVIGEKLVVTGLSDRYTI